MQFKFLPLWCSLPYWQLTNTLYRPIPSCHYSLSLPSEVHHESDFSPLPVSLPASMPFKHNTKGCRVITCRIIIADRFIINTSTIDFFLRFFPVSLLLLLLLLSTVVAITITRCRSVNTSQQPRTNIYMPISLLRPPPANYFRATFEKRVRSNFWKRAFIVG